MSSGLTSMMKNTSSSGMTCMRRSLAAGKSVPPSFCQAIWGAGWPSAAHSSLAVWPVLMVLSRGVLTKDGRTAGGTSRLRSRSAAEGTQALICRYTHR